MINLHAATSLAEDLGLDLVDIYGICKWIQMQASPLNDPDIVREMVRNLPVKEFGEHLKINRLWYNCCKAELWKRYKEAEEKAVLIRLPLFCFLKAFINTLLSQ
ncbi:hypothetical protein GLOIN_2v1779779 [Rhizophagus irregularis DAOM 181602=DAOM 197198]|nr:hypothetical protein GLOIN_2v1779779 [Rhizophagus irregularis DAOM 181602=DAOM 197198]